MKPDSLEQRIVDLELALKHERAVSAAERRRSALLEEAARNAYRDAFRMRLTRTEENKGSTP
jgi:hypothetical protein